MTAWGTWALTVIDIAALGDAKRAPVATWRPASTDVPVVVGELGSTLICLAPLGRYTLTSAA